MFGTPKIMLIRRYRPTPRIRRHIKRKWHQNRLLKLLYKFTSDWDWFTSKDGTVKFAYPKTWGTLTEADKAEAGNYYSDTKTNFMRPIVVSSKKDFLIQVRKSYYDTTWYSWNTTTNKMAGASAYKAPGPASNESYDQPVQLGAPSDLEGTQLAGRVSILFSHVLGHGAMNCGGQHYFFDIKDKVVHISASLCSRDGEWQPQEGQQYVDVVEDPLKDIFKYIQE